MTKGYVYILTNPCFNAYFKSKIVKIGQAKNVEKRRMTLNTSVPVQFEIYATLCTSKYKIVEKKIHQRLKGVSAIKELNGERRVKAENGEFYLITPEFALKVLREESELIDERDKAWDLRGHGRKHAKRATEAMAEVPTQKKLPNFSFSAVGVPVGAVLEFTELPIKVRVKDEKNKVEYCGKPYSLSGFVRAFIPNPNKSGAYQGPKFFTYEGRVLAEMRGMPLSAKTVRPKEENGSDSFVWKNATQLAKAIADKYNGGKSRGHLWQLLNRKFAVNVGSKWRGIFEGIGLAFDKNSFVIDWRTAGRM